MFRHLGGMRMLTFHGTNQRFCDRLSRRDFFKVGALTLRNQCLQITVEGRAQLLDPCGAALDAGVPGRFRVWRADDVMAVLASDPALSFLSTVSGVSRETMPMAIDLVNTAVWNGVRPTVMVLPLTCALPASTRAPLLSVTCTELKAGSRPCVKESVTWRGAAPCDCRARSVPRRSPWMWWRRWPLSGG